MKTSVFTRKNVKISSVYDKKLTLKIEMMKFL